MGSIFDADIDKENQARADALLAPIQHLVELENELAALKATIKPLEEEIDQMEKSIVDLFQKAGLQSQRFKDAGLFYLHQDLHVSIANENVDQFLIAVAEMDYDKCEEIEDRLNHDPDYRVMTVKKLASGLLPEKPNAKTLTAWYKDIEGTLTSEQRENLKQVLSVFVQTVLRRRK